MSIYNSLLKGLNEAIEFEKGSLSLRSNLMYIAEPEEFSASDIKNIRKSTGLSQAAFAAAMGVSKKSIEAWESGRNTPAGTAKRLLAFVESDPHFFEKMEIVEIEDMHETKIPVVYSNTESISTIVITASSFRRLPYKFAGVEV